MDACLRCVVHEATGNTELTRLKGFKGKWRAVICIGHGLLVDTMPSHIKYHLRADGNPGTRVRAQVDGAPEWCRECSPHAPLQRCVVPTVALELPERYNDLPIMAELMAMVQGHLTIEGLPPPSRPLTELHMRQLEEQQTARGALSDAPGAANATTASAGAE